MAIRFRTEQQQAIANFIAGSDRFLAVSGLKSTGKTLVLSSWGSLVRDSCALLHADQLPSQLCILDNYDRNPIDYSQVPRAVIVTNRDLGIPRVHFGSYTKQQLKELLCAQGDSLGSNLFDWIYSVAPDRSLCSIRRWMADLKSKADPNLATTQLFASLKKHLAPKMAVLSVDLPYNTKFLLLAAFLCSYNPPRMDRVLLTRTVAKHKNVKRQQLLGPRSFALGRLLCVFYALVECRDSCQIYSQLQTLCNLGLVHRSNARLKCNTPYDLVLSVAKSIRFDLGPYLYDFK